MQAYLPLPGEIKKLWAAQRPLPAPLYLSYAEPGATIPVLEVVSWPDGLWSKRLWRGTDQQKRLWKFRDRVWRHASRSATGIARTQIRWDDWVFEPHPDTLIELTSRKLLATRGLGRHPEGYAWLYGARHDQADAPWLGLLPSPIRLGLWRDQRTSIGRVVFHYDDNHRYPDRIVFSRPDRPDYRLEKRAVEWRPDLEALGLQPPERVQHYVTNVIAREAALEAKAETNTEADSDE